MTDPDRQTHLAEGQRRQKGNKHRAYETAHGASSAPGRRKTSAARAAEAS